MKKILFALLGLATLLACSTQEPKTLVLYYSQEGSTRAVAEEIQRLTGADLEGIDVTEPYTGNFGETIARCNGERAKGYVPELVPISADISDYDIIFLGYPIWFGTYAPPVTALINSVDLKGKTIVPFCTFGSGGLQESVADLREALPESVVKDGYGVRAARIDNSFEELARFLIEGGYVPGNVDPLPEYSEQHPVSEEETAIFNEACSSYTFPLGIPVTVGDRETIYGHDYEFHTANSTIYVTVPEGKKAEFTIVVR